MDFYQVFQQYTWDEIREYLSKNTSGCHKSTPKSGKRDLEDFKALISPAATGFLEEMAQLSHRLTQKRFGKTIQMYVPLYLPMSVRISVPIVGLVLITKSEEKRSPKKRFYRK
jgi:2-iminoacetate synthase